jgi:hypothetical protein
MARGRGKKAAPVDVQARAPLQGLTKRSKAYTFSQNTGA